jgi:hypothetical protein
MTDADLELLRRKADRARQWLEDEMFRAIIAKIHDTALGELKRLKADTYDYETTRTQLIERMNAADFVVGELQGLIAEYTSAAKPKFKAV